MKILTYHNGGGAPRLGALAGGEHVIDLTAVVPDAMALLEGGERAADAVSRPAFGPTAPRIRSRTVASSSSGSASSSRPSARSA